MLTTNDDSSEFELGNVYIPSSIEDSQRKLSIHSTIARIKVY